MIFKTIRRLFVALALIVACSAFGQLQQRLIVDKISVDVEGPQKVSNDAVMAHLKVRSGLPFDQNSLEMSIKSLYDTDLYERVEVTRILNPYGKLDLKFIVRPKYRITNIAFVGNKEYSTSTLRDKISSYAGGVLDDRRVKRDADKIK